MTTTAPITAVIPLFVPAPSPSSTTVGPGSIGLRRGLPLPGVRSAQPSDAPVYGMAAEVTTTAEKASELLRLHAAPELLLVVNIWDAITATVVAQTPGTTALATQATASPPPTATPTARRSPATR